MAIVIVMIVLWIFQKLFFLISKKPSDPIVMTGKLPLIDDKLIKLKDWRSYMMIKYRLIKETPRMFFLLIRFNLNDLPQFFDLINQEEKFQRQLKDAESANRVSLFDLIVQSLDKSTDSVQLLEQESVRDRDINAVARDTDALFGLRKVTPMEAKKPPSAPVLNQSDANDLYRLLDMISVDVRVKDMIQFSFENRQLFLKIPLIFIEKKPGQTHLRFDPDIALRELKGLDTGNLIQATKDATNMIEIMVGPGQMVIYPINQPKNQIIIPLF